MIMELLHNWMNRGASVFQTSILFLAALLLAPTSSSPLPSRLRTVTSDQSWLMTSQGASKSHLVMWMMTQKQLLPRIERLSNTASDLLICTCQKEGKVGVEECLNFAASLPHFSGMTDVPSSTVLKSEKKKVFGKTLVENAYTSVEELQAVLLQYVTPEGLGDCETRHDAPRFMEDLQTASAQFKDMITSFYKSKLTKGKLPSVAKDQYSDSELAIKLFHFAVNRLSQVSSVLEYSVELSWFSRLQSSAGAGRKRGGAKKNKSKGKNAAVASQ